MFSCSPTRIGQSLATTVAIVAALACPPQARAAARGTVGIDGARVVLGDLDPTAPRDLLKLDIGPSPAPGRTSAISRDAVRVALRRAGADEHLADGLPAKLSVVRHANTLAAKELEPLVKGALLPKLPLGIEVSSVRGLTSVTLPTGEVSVEARMGRLRRSTTVAVSLSVDRKVVARMNAVAMLEGTPRTPTVRSDMPRGATLRSSDITYRTAKLEQLPSGAVTRESGLVGMQLTQPVRAGSSVAKAAVKAPPDVARGATVRVVAIRHGLRISQLAEAQQDGKIGDIIGVKPRTGGKPIRARVHSSAEVRIELGSTR